jgi:hypothetical protein
MPVDISTIPSEDREDFQKRLRVFGIDANAVQEPLAVTRSDTVVLAYGPNRPSARAPFVVETTDFAQVKRMVGIDDRVVATRPTNVALPGRIDLASKVGASGANVLRAPGATQMRAAAGLMMDPDAAKSVAVSDEELRMLDADDVNNVRLAARAFVRGDSKMVASYSPLFEKVIGRITIPVWPILSIHVASGSVLQFGTGVHALVAYQITIEEGGRIVSRGHLTVSCTRMNKPGRAVIRPLAKNLTTAFRPIFNP